MKHLGLVAIVCIVTGCSRGEPRGTARSALAAGSTQVCTLDGEPCYADCPTTVEYNGSSCTFSASEQALRQGLSCSEGNIGRCYYICTAPPGQVTTQARGFAVIGVGGDGYGSGLDAGAGSGSDGGSGSGSDAGTGSGSDGGSGGGSDGGGSGSGSGGTFVYSTASPACTVPASCTEPDGACDASCGGDPDCAPPACDDHDACTVNYVDDSGVYQQDALPCDDNDACTTDSCDPVQGCVHTPITCDDGDACTADRCDSRLGCVAPPSECDDHNQCTTDACGSDGSCSSTPVPDGTPCSDGDDSTFDDTCVGGTCIGSTHCSQCCS